MREVLGSAGRGYGRCEVILVANTESGERIGATSVSLESRIATRKTVVPVWLDAAELDRMIALLETAKRRLQAENNSSCRT